MKINSTGEDNINGSYDNYKLGEKEVSTGAKPKSKEKKDAANEFSGEEGTDTPDIYKEGKDNALGLPQDPQNAPRVKKLKKERPKVDVGLTIVQRLKDCGEPAIGLEYITEFINPKNSSDHPMYTCRLEGCKSAWGTSDDIFNHVIKAKHHKNLFKKLNPEDTRIAGLSSADILVKAAEYEEEQGGSEERDYGVIETVSDYEKYMELRERPDDWSEKKSRLGVSGSSMNSNMEPLGKRGAWGTDQSQTNESSMFDEDEWANWQPPSRNQVLDELRINVTNSVKDVHDMVEEFEGEKGDAHTTSEEISSNSEDETTQQLSQNEVKHESGKSSGEGNELRAIHDTSSKAQAGADRPNTILFSKDKRMDTSLAP